MTTKIKSSKAVSLAALAAAAVTFAMPSHAHAWEQIGYQQADMKRDQDTIAVRGNERHRQIRVCVEQRPLRMRDLDVRFANGGRQDVSLRKRFAPGSCTRVIDLKGKGRNIASITMLYDKVTDGRPAVVKVYAR
ncbi:MAG: hypothetical protein CTY31_01665 [Hyphomicrobium sp.]|nr:MAG: hypothetical protein CTY39_02245 [Hyphomicrobium sp.]PPD01502.1 MAG: hypothetical protein CTY31_01665 [Hyphomicrobium sp.]